ncbi:hypothetical protein TWF718_009986 [Orbilia javanica]|uniref:Uncharacterized protein n=1 Tax=Orbilia javanica TaxID=47235 RepID=A0AAN8MKZ7_9PEZI
MKTSLMYYTIAATTVVYGASVGQAVDPVGPPSNGSIVPRAELSYYDLDDMTIYRLDPEDEVRVQEYMLRKPEDSPGPPLTKEEISTFLRDEPNSLKGFEGCDPIQKGALIQDFLDVRSVFKDLAKDWSRFPINWKGPAAIEFFGPASHTGRYRNTVQCKFINTKAYFHI